ncbi:MAG: tripartite tricarboxylate transporter substrate binding protein [Parvibaculaceae bacterium]
MKLASASVFIGACFVVAGLTIYPSDADAAYPDKPVKLIVGFGPGGPSDIGARFLQRYFHEITGQNLIIINKPGGAGAHAWAEMNKHEPDGYTLTLMSLPHQILQPAVTPDTGYKADELNTILVYTASPQLLVVPKASKIETLQGFIQAAKEQPGVLTVGGAGAGGAANHAAFQRFRKVTGGEFVYIPFSDTASSMLAVKGSQVTASWTWSTQGSHDLDSVRLLGIASDERMKLFPDVPTLRESGIDIVEQNWWGIGVPEGTPEELRRTIAETFRKVAEHPEMLKQMTSAGFTPYLVEYEGIGKFEDWLTKTYEPVIELLKQ